jgi:hypothetical protein
MEVFNREANSYDVTLFVLVEIAGMYYFYPAFTEVPVPLAGPFTLPTVETGFFELWRTNFQTRLPAPMVIGWYSAMIEEGSGALLGDLSFSEVAVQ